jgi:CRP-like cAMP-binding protein
MSQSDASPLAAVVKKLGLWRPLSDDDQKALLTLPFRMITLRPQEYIVREGDRPQSSCLIISGYSFRHKVAGNGGRQIFSIQMRGDLADLENSLLGVADHNLQALSHVEGALIPVNAIQDFAYQAMENLAFDQLEAGVNSTDKGRLGILFHIKGEHDPKVAEKARVGLFDLLRGQAFNKRIALPAKTPVDLTLDTSLNFDELLAAWRRSFAEEEASATQPRSEPARSGPVQP